MIRAIDRFDAYMASSGLNDNKVTVQLNLAVGLIGKSRKPGRDLSRPVIEKILAYYKDLNGVWLLTGEGSMLTGNKSEVPAESDPSDESIVIALLKEQNAELQAKVDMLNQRVGELKALLKREEEVAGAAGGSLSATAV